MVDSPFAGMVGRLVAIHGLERQAELNNMRGRITGVTYPVGKHARWIVAFFCSTGSRTVAIKGANLWFLPDHWVKTTRGSRFDQHGMLTHSPDIVGGTENSSSKAERSLQAARLPRPFGDRASSSSC